MRRRNACVSEGRFAEGKPVGRPSVRARPSTTSARSASPSHPSTSPTSPTSWRSCSPPPSRGSAQAASQNPTSAPLSACGGLPLRQLHILPKVPRMSSFHSQLWGQHMVYSHLQPLRRLPHRSRLSQYPSTLPSSTFISVPSWSSSTIPPF